MKYCCEFCGKTFEKEGVALECEKKHKEEQERNEKLKAEKNKRYDEIKHKVNELEMLIKQFNNDYGDSIWMRTPTPLTNWRTFWL
jgi:DNA repair exonuclease SbcCD ATPase subunit